MRSMRFAQLLARSLVHPGISCEASHIVVTGALNVGATCARVRFRISTRFKDLKYFPPEAECLEHWMRKGADWHNDARMCWVLPDEWRDAMSWRGKSLGSITREGAGWVLAATKSLIARHYLAHIEGFDEWPSEWPFHAHYEEGIRRYRELQRMKHANSRRNKVATAWRRTLHEERTDQQERSTRDNP